jgi:hypothetical protein
MRIKIQKPDWFQIIILILMFIGVIAITFFNDTSLIFRMKYIEEGWWFVEHLELTAFAFLMIGINIGYSISKIRYEEETGG